MAEKHHFRHRGPLRFKRLTKFLSLQYSGTTKVTDFEPRLFLQRCSTLRLQTVDFQLSQSRYFIRMACFCLQTTLKHREEYWCTREALADDVKDLRRRRPTPYVMMELGNTEEENRTRTRSKKKKGRQGYYFRIEEKEQVVTEQKRGKNNDS